MSSIVFLLVFVLVFVWQGERPGANRSILIIHAACKSHSRDLKSLPDSGQVDDDISIIFLSYFLDISKIFLFQFYVDINYTFMRLVNLM